MTISKYDCTVCGDDVLCLDTDNPLCSFACKKTYNTVTNDGRELFKHCEECDTAFGTWPSHDFMFCSRSCYRDYDDKRGLRVGGISEMGTNWPPQREKALDRDSHECQMCGADENDALLDVHHLTPRQHYLENGLDVNEANELSNLITLCRKHHIGVERGGLDAPTPAVTGAGQ